MRALIVALAVTVTMAAPAAAQTPSPAPYVNGAVFSTLVEGDTLYVGGTFTVAGTAGGPLSLVSPESGAVVRSLRGFNGDGVPIMYNKPPLHVGALLADGAGGWYVGGGFDRVDGQPRTSLVHLLADGSVDPAFRADVIGTVTALARHGSTLWVGGALNEIGGAPAYDLGAVDAATGARLPGDPPPRRWINDLVAADGRLYIASDSGLVSVDATTGVRDSWRPEIYGNVEDVAVRDGIVYVAGQLERGWGDSDRRPGAVALRASDASLVTAYDVDSASAIEPGDGVVVVRGSVYHLPYGRTLRAFDATTGADRGWFANEISYGDGALAVSGSRAYLSNVEGTPGELAAFDLTTGARVPWSPPLSGGMVRTLAGAGGVIAVGGDQMALHGVARNNLAAFDLTTGAVKPFAPEPRVKDGPFDPIATPAVAALARAGSLLYVGGRFDTVGGAAQTNLAAVDPVTGARSAFPAATSRVHELAALGGNLYVGGGRGKVGAVQNDGLGAVSLANGSVLGFAPALGCDVNALAVAGDTLHAGGCFGIRSYRDAAPVPGPAGSGTIWTLLGDGAGGIFAGGTGGVAHFDAAGTALGDAPTTDGIVYALALDGGTLSVGGAFTRLAGAPRLNVGQVRDGAVTAFDPAPTNSVVALAPLTGGGMIVCGWMDSTRTATSGGLARFGAGTGIPPTPTATPTPVATATPTATATPDATATPAATATPTATATPAATTTPDATATTAATPTATGTPVATAPPSPAPTASPLPGPRRAGAPAPTRVKIESVTASSVTVSLLAPAGGRQVVLVRLADRRRTVLGRATVALKPGVARTVRVRVRGRDGLRVRAEVGSARSAVRRLQRAT